MEMEAATNFILIGVALWVLNIRRYRWVVQLLVSLVVIISASSLLGVFSGIVQPRGALPISPMATLTVVTFFLLCVGLLLAARQFNQEEKKAP
jgi:polyferredoxin